jgi:hypothetical protein
MTFNRPPASIEAVLFGEGLSEASAVRFGEGKELCFGTQIGWEAAEGKGLQDPALLLRHPDNLQGIPDIRLITTIG